MLVYVQKVEWDLRCFHAKVWPLKLMILLPARGNLSNHLTLRRPWRLQSAVMAAAGRNKTAFLMRIRGINPASPTPPPTFT